MKLKVTTEQNIFLRSTVNTKTRTYRLNYIEEISIKSDAKKIKYYQISKNYCNLSVNSLTMVTQFL